MHKSLPPRPGHPLPSWLGDRGEGRWRGSWWGRRQPSQPSWPCRRPVHASCQQGFSRAESLPPRRWMHLLMLHPWPRRHRRMAPYLPVQLHAGPGSPRSTPWPWREAWIAHGRMAPPALAGQRDPGRRGCRPADARSEGAG